MSVKRISIISVVAILITIIGITAIPDTAKTEDKFQIQVEEIKNPQSELKELNLRYDELTKDLNETSEQQNQDQAEVERLKKEKEELEQKKQELEAQLQAKLDEKKRLADASARAANAMKPSGTASAGGYSPEVIQRMIREAAPKHGLSVERMLRIAKCESTFNPNAVNKNYYAGGGHPSGVYQYLPETWNRIGGRSPYGVGAGPDSRFDPQHNINVTMWAYANGYAGEWECK